MERGTRSMNGGDRRIVGNADRNGGGSRNGSHRERKRRGRRGVCVGNIVKFEERGMISRKRGWKPHVVVHLNVEGRTEGMRKRGMRMIEVTEVRSVDGGTRKQGRRQRR
jgi:hypothetical protein